MIFPGHKMIINISLIYKIYIDTNPGLFIVIDKDEIFREICTYLF